MSGRGGRLSAGLAAEYANVARLEERSALRLAKSGLAWPAYRDATEAAHVWAWSACNAIAWLCGAERIPNSELDLPDDEREQFHRRSA